jgi:hypothetical protein
VTSPDFRGRGVFFALAAVASTLAGLALWAAAGWPGAPNACIAADACFCEAFHSGWIRQPVNTLSNFGFIAVGLALAARAESARAVLFACFIALLGPCSMALHASMTAWGGILDMVSMYLFIGFAISHDAGLLWPGAARGIELSLVPFAAALGALQIAVPRIGPPAFALLVAAFLAVEIGVRLRRAAPGRDPRWLAGAFACFAVAFALWLPSHYSTGALCSPGSLFQPHAAWHLLSALAAGGIFLYLEPELVPASDA